jgi:hypothetical protein
MNLPKLKEEFVNNPNNHDLKDKIYDVENRISETRYLLKAMPYMSKVIIKNEQNCGENQLSSFIKILLSKNLPFIISSFFSSN